MVGKLSGSHGQCCVCVCCGGVVPNTLKQISHGGFPCGFEKVIKNSIVLIVYL